MVIIKNSRKNSCYQVRWFADANNLKSVDLRQKTLNVKSPWKSKEGAELSGDPWILSDVFIFSVVLPSGWPLSQGCVPVWLQDDHSCPKYHIQTQQGLVEGEASFSLGFLNDWGKPFQEALLAEFPSGLFWPLLNQFLGWDCQVCLGFITVYLSLRAKLGLCWHGGGKWPL